MFNFDKDEDGSEDRYKARVPEVWKQTPMGKARHRMWWLLHNLVAHPLIGIFPLTPLFIFHDWTSRRLHNQPPKDG